MASSGNFPLWSPLVKGATNLSLGNTRFDGSTNSRSAVIPISIPTGTKFYVECLVKQMTNYNIVFGLVSPSQDIATYIESQSGVYGMIFHGYGSGDWRTNPLSNGNRQGFNALDDDSTSARVLGMTINRVDNEIKMYIDGTLITNGTISISATDDYTVFASFTGGSQSGVHMNINCGHDSSGAGDFTSGGGNADANGFGDFQNSPPSGFLALCSANLPISSDIDPAETDDDHPAKNFGVLTYTGTGTSGTISGLGFQPDLIWAKRRDGSRRHYLVDSSRGFTKYLHPEGTYTEGTSSTGVTSATSDGFALGGGLDYVNASTHTYVAWCWRCNGGTTSTNTDGALASTVQANQALGFSISLYTSNGTGQSFGHGLGAAPDFFMIKKRDTQERNWMGWHTGLDTASTGYIRWNLTNSQGNDTLWNNTAPSATVINVQKDTTEVNNPSGATYVCYAWRGIEGYSKFGKFEGNSDADGPFVYTGFRPRLVFCKAIDATENWQIRDTERHNNTGSQTRLYWNSDAQEGTASTASPIDFLANGFKVRGSNSEINTNTIIYGAWGDVPFKYGNTHDNG